MSDLDGIDAFDRVLDKLSDAQAGERHQRDRAEDLQSQLSLAQTDNNKLKAVVAQKEQAEAARLPKLTDLCEAADAALKLLNSYACTDPAVVAHLSDALKVAGPHCGRLPF